MVVLAMVAVIAVVVVAVKVLVWAAAIIGMAVVVEGSFVNVLADVEIIVVCVLKFAVPVLRI